MKRALIITYYWPPSGGAGVQRWLKLSKYLPEFGWQPVVYTPENPEAPVEDHSLLKDVHPSVEVIKTPIWEPYGLYKKFVGMKSGEKINAGFLNENEKPEKKEGVSVWVRGNFFIPDARKFWIRPSVRFLKKYLLEHPVDAIISSGPPHSMHLIARQLKRKMNIPWIADFRDPWTEIDFYNQLRLTGRSDQKHKTLEKSVLTEANKVVVIGKTMAARFSAVHAISSVVIPNGFDEEDFQKVQRENSDEISIVHVGAMNKDRNHPAFWEAIAEIKKEKPTIANRLKILLVGKLDISVQQSISSFGLGNQVDIHAYLQHDQIAAMLQSASILYLPINNTPNAKSIQTGKLFEYLAAGRPILGTGPTDGDAADIITSCHAGEMVDFTDVKKIKSVLLNWIDQIDRKVMKHKTSGAEQFSRRNLTAIYAEQLDQITGTS